MYSSERRARERDRERGWVRHRESCICVYMCVCVCVCVPSLKKLRIEMELIEEQLANQTAKQDVIKTKF